METGKTYKQRKLHFISWWKWLVNMLVDISCTSCSLVIDLGMLSRTLGIFDNCLGTLAGI